MDIIFSQNNNNISLEAAHFQSDREQSESKYLLNHIAKIYHTFCMWAFAETTISNRVIKILFNKRREEESEDINKFVTGV